MTHSMTMVINKDFGMREHLVEKGPMESDLVCNSQQKFEVSHIMGGLQKNRYGGTPPEVQKGVEHWSIAPRRKWIELIMAEGFGTCLPHLT